jgi:hypothetical protein
MSAEAGETFNIITAVTNCITALSAVVVAALAVYGVLWEWKKQMKGKTEYEIARRYLKTALKLRDALRYVRNPFIPIEEMQSALKENGLDSEEYTNNQKTNRAVYSVRWKKVIEAWTNMEAELLEAEVSWGIGAVNAQKSLDGLVRELRGALGLFLDGHSKVGKDGNELIYNMGEEDEFSKKIALSIKEIETFLKPYLK